MVSIPKHNDVRGNTAAFQHSTFYNPRDGTYQFPTVRVCRYVSKRLPQQPQPFMFPKAYIHRCTSQGTRKGHVPNHAPNSALSSHSSPEEIAQQRKSSTSSHELPSRVHASAASPNTDKHAVHVSSNRQASASVGHEVLLMVSSPVVPATALVQASRSIGHASSMKHSSHQTRKNVRRHEGGGAACQ